MHPLVTVTINGRPISAGGFFMSQLISLELTDKEGISADTLNIEFAASRFTHVPRKKDKIKVWLGYQETGTSYFGSFDVNDAELQCVPYRIQVSAKASDMKSDLKTHQSRHWDEATIQQVFSELAQENGLAPLVSGQIASVTYPYINMEDESTLHFGQRIARRENGLFDIKDGKLIMVDKGAGLSGSGLSISPLVITPNMCLVGSCSTRFTGRDSHKSVEAQYHDKENAKRVLVEAMSDPEGEGVLRIKHAFEDERAAQAAAHSKAKELQRAATSTSVAIEGNVLGRAGQPMSYSGFHPEIDGIPFIIEAAQHSFSKSGGWITALTAKIKV